MATTVILSNSKSNLCAWSYLDIVNESHIIEKCEEQKYRQMLLREWIGIKLMQNKILN